MTVEGFVFQMIDWLPPNSTDKDIQNVTRKFSSHFHPDKMRKNEEWANSNMQQVNEAINIFKDEEKRESYKVLKLQREEENLRKTEILSLENSENAYLKSEIEKKQNQNFWMKVGYGVIALLFIVFVLPKFFKKTTA